MTIVNVTVKWKSHVYNDLQLNTGESLMSFKEKLWKLTNVPPEKQKLMYKGLIKDDTDLSTLNIKNNDKIMLVGSSETLIERPTQVIFVEDLSKEDKEKLHAKENIIFEDQGEFLRNIKRKEKHSLKSSSDILFDSYIHFSQTFGKSPEPFVPLELLKSFRDVFPKFKTVNLKTKQYAQQDAEECMNAILTSLNEQNEFKISDKLFSFKVLSTLRCIEDVATDGDNITCNNATSANTPQNTETTEEFHNKLICYMGTQNTPVNHMHEGIRLSLIEKIRKQRSEDNKEDALFEKKSELISLPPYLIVHFLRFESKKISEPNNSVSVVTAKICRKVSFPETFDIYDFCSSDLKARLNVARNIIMKRKEADLIARMGNTQAVEDFAEKNVLNEETAKGNNQSNQSSNIETAIQSQIKVPKEETGEEVIAENHTNAENVDGRDNNPVGEVNEIPTGEYELISIITHKGRNEESGHYIAWKKMRKYVGTDTNTDKEQLNKKTKNPNDSLWFKMDDDKVSTYKYSSLDLCGGCSDYNIAVLLLYKRKTLSCTLAEFEEYGK